MIYKIQVNKSGTAYLPTDIRNLGIDSEVEAVTSPFVVVLIKPGATVDQICDSMTIVKKELKLRSGIRDNDT